MMHMLLAFLSVSKFSLLKKEICAAESSVNVSIRVSLLFIGLLASIRAMRRQKSDRRHLTLILDDFVVLLFVALVDRLCVVGFVDDVD